MASGAMVGILPPPSYRHRQPPPPPSPSTTTPASSSSAAAAPPPPPPRPSTQSQQPPSSQQQQQRQNQQDVQQKPQPPQQLQQQQHPQLRQGTSTSLPTTATATAKNNNNNNNTSNPSVPQTAASGVPLASLAGGVLAGGGGGGAGGSEAAVGDLLGAQQAFDLSYMHRPPTILPNYGKRSRGSILPKSNVSRVLLYDNITQQTMLDVRINSIRSQSYKTNRELDMHMKSFMSRRRIQEKALKKITRVEHFDDYVEFTQDQEPTSSYFPGIGSHKSGGNKKLLTSARSMPSLPTYHHGAHHHQKRSHKKHGGASRENTLPRITVSSLSGDSNKDSPGILSRRETDTDPSLLPQLAFQNGEENNYDDDNDDINNDKSDDRRTRKVGVQFVKGEKGVTRVFKVVTDDDHDDNDGIPTPRNENSSPHRSTVMFADPPNDKNKMDENNNSPTTPDNNEPSNNTNTISAPAMPHLQPRKSIFQIQKEKAQEEEEVTKLQEKNHRQGSALSDIPFIFVIELTA